MVKKLSQIVEQYLDTNNITDIQLVRRTEGVLGITFENIDFDICFIWKEQKNLKIDLRHNIESINNINTSSNSDIQKISFKNCNFKINPIILYEKVWHLEFDNCKFNSIDDLSEDLLRYQKESKRLVFYNCDFEYFKIGGVEDIRYRKGVKLSRFFLSGGKINHFIIQNIELDTKLYFNSENKIEIENLTIKNAIFKENFKLCHCNIKNVSIEDTDFKKQANFDKSSFHNGINNHNDKTIYFKALNFEGLTIFSHCDFTKKVVFSVVTFENFVHFKEANFKNGLDLDYTNIQKEINFFGMTGLDSRESQDNTSQETYRIVKYNFQKIGNQIEANKYHALELNKHRQDIWYKIRNLSFLDLGFYCYIKKIGLLGLEMLPSLIHRASSNYGQSWLLPLIWILIVGLITNYFICSINECSWNSIFNWSEILKHVSIINLDEALKKYPIIFLFNKISLGYLYYQFINATRKHIKK
ncbi:MAG: pentapeptide repeat-containing protein [Sulfurovum sp.]|nr:pentapeptide repeat-containing protein [Sulfurovum sp.]